MLISYKVEVNQKCPDTFSGSRTASHIMMKAGEELRDDKAARLATKRLARDLEDTLEPGGSWNVEVRDGEGPVYSIRISARCLRIDVR